MNAARRGTVPVATLTVSACRLLIAATGIHWLVAGDDLSLAVALAALAITFVPGLLIRDLPLRETTSVVVAILLAAHVVLGMHGALYETSTLYDKSVHFAGSGAIAAVLVVAVLRYCDRRRVDVPLAFCLLFALGGAVSAGTLWELFEFAVDLTGLFRAQRGLRDTMLDLLADTAGAGLVTVTFAAFRQMRHR